MTNEGFSARLPEPLAAWARTGWDAGTFHGRRWARLLPAPLVQRFSHLAERLQRPELAVVTGVTPGGSRIAYAGNDVQLRAALFGALGGARVEPGSPVSRTAFEQGLGADVELFEIPAGAARRMSQGGWLVLPRWVEFEVDLRRPERELWDGAKRERVRRIERAGLEPELCRDEAAAREFHERLYVPTAHVRHGARAFVRRWDYVKRAARGGYLLFVRAGGERRAGLLLVPRRGSAIVDAWLFGVRDGAYAETRLAREAVYLHALRWARDRLGARGFGLTAGPPLLRDGLVRFKKRWGASAAPGLRHGTALAVRVIRGRDDLIAAFAESPLLAVGWQRGSPELCAPVPRLAGSTPGEVPGLPGVRSGELLLERAEQLPAVFSAYARAGAG